jgi:hypothetical protein
MEEALYSGLSGVAVLTPKGEPIRVLGDLEHDELRALAALFSKQGTPDLLDRLFRGEIATESVDADRIAYLAIAARCAFVVAVSHGRLVSTAASYRSASRLRQSIDAVIRTPQKESSDFSMPPPGSAAGGSGSPPAEAFVFLPRRDESS